MSMSAGKYHQHILCGSRSPYPVIRTLIPHKVTGAFRFHKAKVSDLNLETNLSAEGRHSVMPQSDYCSN